MAQPPTPSPTPRQRMVTDCRENYCQDAGQMNSVPAHRPEPLWGPDLAMLFLEALEKWRGSMEKIANYCIRLTLISK